MLTQLAFILCGTGILYNINQRNIELGSESVVEKFREHEYGVYPEDWH